MVEVKKQEILIQKTLKKDMLHLSLSILMLVLLPISAFIYHNLEVWYYIIPCYLAIVFFKGFMDTYALYKK